MRRSPCRLPSRPRIDQNAPIEIYHGFTLVDGTGGPPIEDAAISVRGNGIVAVGSRQELLSGPAAPRDAIVINLGGGYVIPGLIDSHVHLSTSPDRQNAEAELHRLLYGGVTAVRDMAGDARALASLAPRFAAGRDRLSRYLLLSGHGGRILLARPEAAGVDRGRDRGRGSLDAGGRPGHGHRHRCGSGEGHLGNGREDLRQPAAGARGSDCRRGASARE